MSVCTVVAIGVYAVTWWSIQGERWINQGSTSDRATDLLSFSLICGLSSMATIEAVKKMTGLRGWYQRSRIDHWMTRRIDMLPQRQESSHFGGLLQLHFFMQLQDRRVFDLPIEQLSAQFAAAMDLALATPEKYKELIEALVGEDLSSIIERERDEPPGQRAHSSFPSRYQEPFPATGAEVAQRVQRTLDQLQISVGHSWDRFIQATALWVSGAYGIVLANSLGFGGVGVHTLASLVIGGVSSWLLHDIFYAIERRRR